VRLDSGNLDKKLVICPGSQSRATGSAKSVSNPTKRRLMIPPEEVTGELRALRETYYHGTRADLKPGDVIKPGYYSNYGKRKKANHVYLTATLDAATWGAELALGTGPGRIYIVEPTGPIVDDPNLTDKKFPGNPTRSYRSREPLQVTGEVTEWQGHSAEAVQAMKDHIEGLSQLGIEAIDD